MSTPIETPEPTSTSHITEPAVELVLDGHTRDLGGLKVARTLPAMQRRMIGPFAFFDHMDATLEPGTTSDVRPHPHIHLATVTYLFEGEIIHRDSLGSVQPIRPGELNWMHAGRGIVHSERRPEAQRGEHRRLHGLQLWVALPAAEEDTEASFSHYATSSLPTLTKGGASLTIIAGEAYGQRSPAPVRSPLFYVDVKLSRGAELQVDDTHAERAAYVVEGAITCGEQRAEPRRALVFRTGARAVIRAESDARVMLFGGAPLDGPRHIFWNFVSSSKENIEKAKRDWREGRFPKVPGDEIDFIPLPEG